MGIELESEHLPLHIAFDYQVAPNSDLLDVQKIECMTKGRKALTMPEVGLLMSVVWLFSDNVTVGYIGHAQFTD